MKKSRDDGNSAEMTVGSEECMERTSALFHLHDVTSSKSTNESNYGSLFGGRRRRRGRHSRFSDYFKSKKSIFKNVDLNPLKEQLIMKSLLYVPREKFISLSLLMLLSYFGASFMWLVGLWMVHDGLIALTLIKKLVTKNTRLAWTPDVDHVFFMDPEVETVGWFNKILGKLWLESLRGLASRDIKQLVNKFINNKLTKMEKSVWWFKWIKSPKFVDLDIGQTHPWVTGISIYTDAGESHNRLAKSITMDVGVIAHLLPTINLMMNKYLVMGLERFKFAGIVRIRLNPILRDLHLIGNVNVSLMDLPTIDYQFTGLLACLNFPPIKYLCRQLVKEVFSLMVYPAFIEIPFMDKETIERSVLTPSAPIGVLRTEIVEGRGLSAADLPLIFTYWKQSDPYVHLAFGAYVSQSQVVRKTLNPKWNFVRDLPITERDYLYREIHLSVMDWDWGPCKEDDVLGFTSVSIKRAVDITRLDDWFALGQGEGEVHLRLRFVPIGGFDDVPRKLCTFHCQAVFSVLIFEVNMSEGEVYRPMVVVELSGHPAKTTSKGHAGKNWEVAEEFMFSVHDVATDKLTLTLVNADKTVSSYSRVIRAVMVVLTDPNDADKEDASGPLKGYERIAEATVDLAHFNGNKQKINLVPDAAGSYSVTVTGSLHYVHPPLDCPCLEE